MNAWNEANRGTVEVRCDTYTLGVLAAIPFNTEGEYVMFEYVTVNEINLYSIILH